jgi:ribosomal protein S19
MSRSLKKGPFVDFKLYRKVQKQEEAGTKEPIKTWAGRARSSLSSWAYVPGPQRQDAL